MSVNWPLQVVQGETYRKLRRWFGPDGVTYDIGDWKPFLQVRDEDTDDLVLDLTEVETADGKMTIGQDATGWFVEIWIKPAGTRKLDYKRSLVHGVEIVRNVTGDVKVLTAGPVVAEREYVHG